MVHILSAELVLQYDALVIGRTLCCWTGRLIGVTAVLGERLANHLGVDIDSAITLLVLTLVLLLLSVLIN